MSEEQPQPNPSPEGEKTNGPPRRRRIRARHIAYAALAIAIGHVIYAICATTCFTAPLFCSDFGERPIESESYGLTCAQIP